MKALKLIKNLYFFLIFATPLLVSPGTNELFELPKMAFVYLASGVISILWISKKKPLEFSKPLKLILMLLIIPKTLSLLLSTHFPTSFFGYYTRFNGSLLSLISFSILLTIFTNVFTKKDANKILNWTLAGGVLVSVYAIFQHFGIDKNVWVQDSQKRVFSTLGQPNWLASYLVFLIPTSINRVIKIKKGFKNLLIYATLFLGLLFTYSLSGAIAFVLVVVLITARQIRTAKRLSPRLIQVIAISFALFITFPGLYKQRILDVKNSLSKIEVRASTEYDYGRPKINDTSKIRALVWKGTVKLITSSPKVFLMGTGPQTFAYSFLPFRPIELNTTTEWDFIFNKPHNYFLEIWADTGLINFISFITATIVILKLGFKTKIGSYLSIGIIGVYITYFFGWPTVTTELLFTVFVGIIILNFSGDSKLININFVIFITIISFILTAYGVLLFSGDVLNKKGSSLAIKLNPFEPKYQITLAKKYYEMDQYEKADGYIKKAVKLNPGNMVTLKTASLLYQKMGPKNPIYVDKAIEIYERTITLCPTDPENYLNLAKVYLQKEEIEKSINFTQKALELKNGYFAAQRFNEQIYQLPD